MAEMRMSSAPSVAPGVAAGGGGIPGALPWGGAGANPLDYAGNYNASLAQNRGNYENIMAGYNATLAKQTAAQEAIQAGYTKLSSDVLAGIAGIGQSRVNDINAAATANWGSGQQSLINRGLGNSTVMNSVQRGIESDKQRALTANANQVAGLTAGYQSQIGQAGLGFGAMAAGRNAGLMQDQLAFMNSMRAGYPNAALYNQLAQQRGAADAANRMYGRGGYGGGFGFGPQYGTTGQHAGYVPAPVPNFGGASVLSPLSTGFGGASGFGTGGMAGGGPTGYGMGDYGGGGDYGPMDGGMGFGADAFGGYGGMGGLYPPSGGVAPGWDKPPGTYSGGSTAFGGAGGGPTDYGYYGDYSGAAGYGYSGPTDY